MKAEHDGSIFIYANQKNARPSWVETLGRGIVHGDLLLQLWTRVLHEFTSL